MAVTQREVDEAMRALILEELDAMGYGDEGKEFPHFVQERRSSKQKIALICAFGWIGFQLLGFISTVNSDLAALCVMCVFVAGMYCVWQLLKAVMRLCANEKGLAANYLVQLAQRYPDKEITELIGETMQKVPDPGFTEDHDGPKRLRRETLLRRAGAALLAVCTLAASPVQEWALQQHYLSDAAGSGYRRAAHTFVPYGDGVMLAMGGSDYANAKELIIPDEADGKPVVAIGELAFSGFAMERVVVPDSVTTMGSGVFKNCIRLKQAELGAGLTELGAESFMNCKRLQSIVIPKGVTEIRGNTFEDCKALTSVTMHDGITSIHGYAFRSCSSLRSIDLPPKITEVRGNTFENCTSLRSIVIPEGVTRIAAHAFRYCTSLSSVDMPSTVASIGSSAFRSCEKLESVLIPSNCSVDEKAFKESPTRVHRITFR